MARRKGWTTSDLNWCAWKTGNFTTLRITAGPRIDTEEIAS